MFGKSLANAQPKPLRQSKTKDLSKAEVLDRFGCVVGVRDVSLSVALGEVFCIMGLSGSGKSTLVRHINRLIEPTAGQIIINNQDVNALNAEGFARATCR